MNRYCRERPVNKTKKGIALVGGTGYLGQSLSHQLTELRKPHWLVSRGPAQAGQVPIRSSNTGLRKAVSGASAVFHLATLTTPAVGFKNPALDVENIQFTLALLEACKAEKVGRFIFISSGGTVYGAGEQPHREEDPAQPSCSHGAAKLASEHFIRLFQERTGAAGYILRVTNAYGGGQKTKGEQGVVSYMAETIRSGRPLRLLGDTVRDYVYVDDVVDAMVRTLQGPPGFHVLNISTGVGTSLSALAGMIMEILGRSVPIQMDQPRSFDLPYNVLDNARAKKILCWTPTTSLRQGLSSYLLP